MSRLYSERIDIGRLLRKRDPNKQTMLLKLIEVFQEEELAEDFAFIIQELCFAYEKLWMASSARTLELFHNLFGTILRRSGEARSALEKNAQVLIFGWVCCREHEDSRVRDSARNIWKTAFEFSSRKKKIALYLLENFLEKALSILSIEQISPNIQPGLCVEDKMRIKTMVICSLHYFLDCSQENGFNPELLEQLILAIPINERFEVSLAKSLLNLTIHSWQSGMRVSSETERIVMKIAIDLADDPEFFESDVICRYLACALKKASLSVTNEVYNKLEWFAQRTGFLGEDRSYFVEIISSYIEKYEYDSERIFGLIAKLILFTLQKRKHSIESILMVVQWLCEKLPHEDTIVKHMSGILYVLVFSASQISVKEIGLVKSLVQLFTSHDLQGILCPQMELLVVCMRRKQMGLFLAIVPEEYRDEREGRFDQFSQNLVCISYLYFSSLFAPSTESVTFLFQTTIERLFFGPAPGRQLKYSALELFSEINSNSSWLKASRLPVIAAEILLKVRNTDNEVYRNDEMEKRLFDVSSRSTAALKMIEAAGAYTLAELSLGLTNDPSSEILNGLLTLSINRITESTELREFGKLFKNLDHEVRDKHLELLITRAFQLEWNEETFSFVFPLLTKDYRYLLVKTVNWRSHTTSEELFCLYENKVITDSFLEAVMIDLIRETKSAFLRKEAIVISIDSACAENPSQQGNQELFFLMIPLIAENIAAFDSKLLVQLLPFGRLSGCVSLIQKIVQVLDEPNFFPSLQVVQEMYDRQCPSWSWCIFHNLCNLVTNVAWHSSIAAFIWHDCIQVDSLENAYVPPSLCATSQVEMYITQIGSNRSMTSWRDCPKISFCLWIARFAPINSIDRHAVQAVSERYLVLSEGEEPDDYYWIIVGFSALLSLYKRLKISDTSLQASLLRLIFQASKKRGLIEREHFAFLDLSFLSYRTCQAIVCSMTQLVSDGAGCAYSRAMWRKIGSLYINLSTWVLENSTIEHDSIALDDLIFSLKMLGNEPFIKESVRSLFSEDMQAVRDFLNHSVRFTRRFEVELHFPCEKVHGLYASLVRPFCNVLLAQWPTRSIDKEEALFSNILLSTLRQNPIYFPSQAATKFQWFCFLSFWGLIVSVCSPNSSNDSELWNCLKGILPSVFQSIAPLLSFLVNQKQQTPKIGVDSFFNEEHSTLELVSAFLEIVIERIPLLIVHWHGCAPTSIRKQLESFVDTRSTSGLMAEEVKKLKSSCVSNDFKISFTTDTVSLTYTHDYESIQLRLRFPRAYPLYPIEPYVENLEKRRTFFGMKNATIRSFLLSIRMQCATGISVLEVAKYWLQTLNSHLVGKLPCPVCCSIIHPETKRIPESRCGICRHSVYHQICLFDWFKKSGNNTCPTCRSAWNSWKK
ncbi:hypothetical protein XU18_2955 [Perkinsela sp. CCAP 1560/4]|nr:hypothetical protein XU18_2955 [Perkinsela sp. CCAP 1560/4]|eukprot:KNH06199.1 hypothetical protein XU18_2955 [Perkinsela sp. CCAP 1560/4]